MRVLVCGDRNWSDRKLLFEVLDDLKVSPTIIIEGCATGADQMAGYHPGGWAWVRDINSLHFPAKWNIYGRSAGPIRNRLMVREGKPDLVIAFHDDIEHSRGTKDMMKVADHAKIEVVLYGHGRRLGRD